MTLEEANKIVNIWGRYLEYSSGKLNLIFGAYIPESFLPFKINILEEAINIVAEYHHDLGDKKAVKDLQSTIGYLLGYKDDEEAVLQTAKMFSNKKWRDAMLPVFKNFQNEWLEMQGVEIEYSSDDIKKNFAKEVCGLYKFEDNLYRISEESGGNVSVSIWVPGKGWARDKEAKMEILEGVPLSESQAKLLMI